MTKKEIVADITRQLLTGRTLGKIWFDAWRNLSYLKVLLTKFHVDPNIKNEYNNTVLYIASRNGNLNMVKYLVEHGADVNIQNRWGETALYQASNRNGHLDIIRYLVEHGADVNIKDEDSKTVLHWSKTKDVKDLLKQYGAR